MNTDLLQKTKEELTDISFQVGRIMRDLYSLEEDIQDIGKKLTSFVRPKEFYDFIIEIEDIREKLINIGEYYGDASLCTNTK